MNTEEQKRTAGESRGSSRSRLTGREGSGSRRGKAAEKGGGLNLPGILIAALFVLVEGWFFFRLLRLGFLPSKYMWLIGAALLLLAVLVAFLCWNSRRKTRFIIGAVLALLGSAGLVIGSGVVDKVRSSVQAWEAPTTEAVQTVKMGIYVMAEDSIRYIEELSGQTLGIMENIDRSEAEQVLDEIARHASEHLQVRTYNGFTEVIQALYKGEIRGAVLEQTFIEILAGISGYSDIAQRVRMISDYTAERPTTAPAPTKEAEPAASTQPDETTTTVQHGSRSWSIIRPSHTEASETQEPETPAEASATAELPEGPIETAPPSTPVPTAWSINVPAGQEGRIFTVYISGLDTRGGGLASRGNSDVNILAVVNMNSKQLLLLSTPRDFYVPFPSAGGTPDKLTHAGYYGVQASMDALRSLYGVASQYYVRIGFEGFRTLIDAMDGVDVYSAYSFTTDHYEFTTGTNHVNGSQALEFVRHRKTLPGGDRARGNNQMAMIKAVAQKLASASSIANISEILDAVGGLAQTTMPYDTISGLARGLLDGGWNVVSYAVNGSNGMTYSFSIGETAYVMYPDYSTVNYARSLIQKVYNGEWVSP